MTKLFSLFFTVSGLGLGVRGTAGGPAPKKCPKLDAFAHKKRPNKASLFHSKALCSIFGNWVVYHEAFTALLQRLLPKSLHDNLIMSGNCVKGKLFAFGETNSSF